MAAPKEEAERLVKLAESCILDEKFDAAEDYIQQALNIHPSPKIQEALSLLKQRSGRNETAEPTLRRRKAESEDSPKFTEEQVQFVERIKSANDYYEILAVSKKATSTELKQAFKNRCLEVHPDKNKAPGATEAFQAVGLAFGVLIDPEKREEYDSQGIAMKLETGEIFGQNLALLVLGFIGMAGIGALAWHATKSSRASKKK
ncbi:dnaJ homolog subfamily B member 12-like isoform X2 [Belonocnema kinseyi]|nr:dnaJ homolog subfamily B member 12-like isoform X2 [Belonocnema kinseyi]XP_033210039.1 dnaJ homolog subfamily B member 12-like isoform X2 [Belonocnema kinseyi]XP_033210048.1 dnaJ homolog subfamily B member 12-like isoform X2 [Belonocnema kinseyi]XP_033210058.1 dnaJ homolog subfamily B member 12-like isoform X2 [Belonocnema kinseyi]